MNKRFPLVAMCLATLFLFYACDIEKPESEAPDLPKVRVNGNIGEMIGIIQYAEDPNDLIEGNPWTESLGLTAMPVFEYGLYQNGEFCSDNGFSQEEAVEQARQVAEALDLTVDSIDTSSYNPEIAENFAMIEAVCGDVLIYASLDGMKYIQYKENPLELPAGYEFDPQSKAQTEKASSWLVEKYSKPLGIKNPKSFVRNEYGQGGGCLHNIVVYAQGENPVDMLLNYSFSSWVFNPEIVVDVENDNILFPGRLSTITYVGQLDLMQRMADYPIISVEEAREALLSGNFYSEAYTNEALRPSNENIACVELVYDKTHSETIMPYYRFWVGAPRDYVDQYMHMFSEELIAAGAMPYFSFYVPAIQSDYLDTTDVLTWNEQTIEEW